MSDSEQAVEVKPARRSPFKRPHSLPCRVQKGTFGALWALAALAIAYLHKRKPRVNASQLQTKVSFLVRVRRRQGGADGAKAGWRCGATHPHSHKHKARLPAGLVFAFIRR
ncbi:MAG: hypothetical protein BroJett014_04850 [Planctomycetota bacterium]|nr:hypothetical protein [Planctomycetota bacterium]GIK51512.1 MAG: hypothetical protein BroJett014_04850 [Planctomycetota bacterium]